MKNRHLAFLAGFLLGMACAGFITAICDGRSLQIHVTHTLDMPLKRKTAP